MKKIAASLLSLVILLQTNAQQVSIIPQPTKITQEAQGATTINAQTVIVLASADLAPSANFLNDYLQSFFGFKLKLAKTASGSNAIVLSVTNMASENGIPGAYTLKINQKGIQVKGANPTGTFYGIQSLIQILPTVKTANLSVPYLTVEDHPRFAYRGMHLDVGRHFFSVDYVKKYIDFIAMHKMNNFHWHLTEDQGWRIEIKKYPNLTKVGGFRNGTIIGRYPGTGNTNTTYGGFYTQEEIKQVVKYAADRYITVIPEIEMPGHASAAIAAYPQLSCFPDSSTKHPAKLTWVGSTVGKQVQQGWGVYEDVFAPTEYTFNFLQNVLDEVLALFPSTLIHIGGDECPKTAWKNSAFCQQLIKAKNLKDEHGLQSYFIQRIEKYLNSKGRQIIGWDEILEGGLAPNAAVMSWRGEEGGIAAAKQKHTVIMTPNSYAYFDHSQTKKDDSLTIGGYLTVQKVYDYEPIPKELSKEDEKYVLGAQANLWTEYIPNWSKIEYMTFPRMTAMSEVLWSQKGQRNCGDFQKRLAEQIKKYEFWNWNYSKAVLNPAAELTDKK